MGYYFKGEANLIPRDALGELTSREFVKVVPAGETHRTTLSSALREGLRPATIEEISVLVANGTIQPPSDSRYGSRVYVTGTIRIGQTDEMRPALDWELHNMSRVDSFGGSLACVGVADIHTFRTNYVLVKAEPQQYRLDTIDAFIADIERILKSARTANVKTVKA